jgi:hypothetical protein
MLPLAELPERDLTPITEREMGELTQVFKLAAQAWPGTHIGLALASIFSPGDPAVFFTPAGTESDLERTYFLTGDRWVSFVTHFMNGNDTTDVFCYEHKEGEGEGRLVARFETKKAA